MYFSDQGTDYLELHWCPYVSKILSPKMAPNFQDVENAYNENWPTLCAILGFTIFEPYGNQCIPR